jgi:hypothetical protein
MRGGGRLRHQRAHALLVTRPADDPVLARNVLTLHLGVDLAAGEFRLELVVGESCQLVERAPRWRQNRTMVRIGDPLIDGTAAIFWARAAGRRSMRLWLGAMPEFG